MYDGVEEKLARISRENVMEMNLEPGTSLNEVTPGHSLYQSENGERFCLGLVVSKSVDGELLTVRRYSGEVETKHRLILVNSIDPKSYDAGRGKVVGGMSCKQIREGEEEFVTLDAKLAELGL